MSTDMVRVESTREERLSSVLSEFARTLVTTDFAIQTILDHLVERITDVLPVSASGVTLISRSHDPHYIAASDSSALEFEQVQTELGEGPCLAAYASAEAVTVPDLQADGRFPAFTEAALEAGLRAVFAFPLRDGSGVLGALDLYRESPGELDAWELAAAQTLADVATAYLLNVQSRVQARETSDRFRHSSLHDPLTGLANRALLMERLDHAAERGRRSHAEFAVLFVDLDRFKHVNDTHGHQVGDDLLVAVGKRLSAVLRPGDTLARLSGDEFVILCEDLTTGPSDVRSLAWRVDQAFTAPFRLPGAEIQISASVGIAFSGRGEDLPRQLMHEADRAMYRAKRRGGNHEIHDLRQPGHTARRLDLALDLQAAMAADDLKLFYQPIVSTSDGELVGVEAMLRWFHPVLGPIRAQDLVAMSEQSGLITAVGAWALDRACSDMQSGHLASDRQLEMSVNVSASQLTTYGFVPSVRRALQRTGIDPADLVLELTEGIFLEDTTHARNALDELKRLGVTLALDDFGSGFSSLAYLGSLPIDILKIDRTLVAGVGRDATAIKILVAVTDLAHKLGMRVIAEGVETRSQLDRVVEAGCDATQGFFYSAAVPAVEIPAMIRDWGTDPPVGPGPVSER